MANFVQGYQLRTLVYGVQVTKATQALPQTATSTLFTVSGGAVLVQAIVGQVTTATGATATNLSLGTVPTIGSSNSASLASATAITSLEAGTWLSVQATSSKGGGALLAGTNAGTTLYPSVPFIVAAGTITWTTSASDTGAISWYLDYVPLDTGASVS